jgi:hypothetical protein
LLAQHISRLQNGADVGRRRFAAGARPSAQAAIAAGPEDAAIRVPVAGMIHRPDRDIETGTAGAARHCQGDGDGKNERTRSQGSRP